LVVKRLEDYKLDPKLQPVYERKVLSGLVVKTQSGFYSVQTPEGLVISQIAGRLKELKEDSPYTSDLVALGDYVTLDRQTDGAGFILEVAERHHVLSRVAPSSAVGTSVEEEQILLANCDQAFFVFAAHQPQPQPRMLDRFLVVAEKAQLDSIVIIVNKIDLSPNLAAIQSLFAPYLKMGYQVLHTSVLNQIGIQPLRDLMKDRLSIFAGPSGVGKSSLLNMAHPGLSLQTGTVSQSNQKGRHTTRFSQLIPLEGGGYVADTPGIRAIAPWDVEPAELDSYFRELRPLVGQCGFNDCMHIHEPGCAVRAAVENGTVTRERYESYLRLRDELEEQYIYL
jgi:ribosome biogenesis GTPase